MHTVLKPSLRAPGVTGVFAARDLKRGTLLVPSASFFDTVPSSTDSANNTAAGSSTSDTSQQSNNSNHHNAMILSPLNANLLHLPLHKNKLSFFEFLMQRHQWSNPDTCRIVSHATKGVFVVTPRSLTPQWMVPATFSHSVPLSAFTNNHSKTMDKKKAKNSGGSSLSRRRTVLVPEEHFFQMRESFEWHLPPADDLASPEYWQLAKRQGQVYKELLQRTDEQLTDLFGAAEEGGDSGTIVKQNGGGSTVVEELKRQRANCRLRVYFPPTTSTSSPSKKTTQRRQKNIIQVGVPAIELLRPLQQGEELTLHYGLEWWAQSLLSRVFLAASDSELGRVRWIESLVAQSLSLNTSVASSTAAEWGNEGGPQEDVERKQDGPQDGGFPLLKLCYRKRNGSKSLGGLSAKLRVAAPRHRHEIDLASVLDRQVATNEQLLAFAVRRSCQSAVFLKILAMYVFLPSQSSMDNAMRTDSFVPYDRLRHVLIQCVLHGDEMALEVLDAAKKGTRKENKTE